MPDWLASMVTAGVGRRVDYGMKNRLALASVMLLMSCNSSGPVNNPLGSFRHSASTFQCGPADGPATAVLLARDAFDGVQPGNPHVRVVILRAAADLPGTSWNIGTSFDDAGALYFNDAGTYEAATSGMVRITRVEAQQRVEGSVSLRFPSRTVVEDFSAPWVEPFMLCG